MCIASCHTRSVQTEEMKWLVLAVVIAAVTAEYDEVKFRYIFMSYTVEAG